jgi:exodeoxyribonuclease V alpha subunit
LGGVEHINQILQNRINPDGARIPFKNADFRVGDRVMQLKNDYDRDVFNGDIGTIIGADEKTTRIDFDGKIVDYSKAKNDFDNLALAYACTVHKSQGSEYPAVILPLLTGPRMLFTRNLLYTAVTRAKKCVMILGSEDTVRGMIGNVRQKERFTSLSERILELAGEESANDASRNKT